MKKMLAVFSGIIITIILLSFYLKVEIQYIQIYLYPLLIVFGAILGSNYSKRMNENSYNWIDPIIQLSVMIIKLDGVEDPIEKKRIEKYLNLRIYGEEIAEKKIRFYREQLNEVQDLEEICKKIKKSNDSIDSVILLRFLVYLALSDRLLTEKEKLFLQKVTKNLGLSNKTLKAILNLRSYITEEDLKNQQNYKPRANFGLPKAYSILGLDSTANMDEVKEAYRELAKVYHPDKQRGSEKGKDLAKAQFQVIVNAYELIKKKSN